MREEPFELKHHSFFGGLEDSQIETVAALMQTETAEQGAAIIREGDRNDRIYFILEGEVEVAKRGIPLRRFIEGDSFGEMEVIDIMPAEATITALSPVRLMSLSNAGLHSLSKTDLKAFAMLIMNLARDMSRRLRSMNRLYTASGSLSPEGGEKG